MSTNKQHSLSLTCRKTTNGHNLETLDPLVETAESPSFVVFCASGPPIADDSEAIDIELQAWTQQLERGRVQSGQWSTVAPGEMPSVGEVGWITDDGQYKFLLVCRLYVRSYLHHHDGALQ